MGLSAKGYGLHGTNQPMGVGRRVSQGSRRMYDQHIASIYNSVEIGTQVIQTGEAYQVLWHEHWDQYDKNGKLPLPEIDFEYEMVVIIHYGAFPSGALREVDVIRTIEKEGSNIYVTLAPLPELGAWAAFSHPVQAVRLEKYDLEVIFEGDLP